MMETWHPLGVVGVISAFNFPVAVWSWNAALALVCGNSVVWKPSEKTPLTALACQAIFERAAKRFGDAPKGLSADHHRRPRHRRSAGRPSEGAARLRHRLDPHGPRCRPASWPSVLAALSSNSAATMPASSRRPPISTWRCAPLPSAPMGTAGQRCTTLRRLFVHDSVYDKLVPALRKPMQNVTVGSPLTTKALVGPLIDKAAFDGMQKALGEAKAEHGGKVTGGERVENGGRRYYVRPALVEMPKQEGPCWKKPSRRSSM
jgi:aldehyde dehydrogenase (NAD+)